MNKIILNKRFAALVSFFIVLSLVSCKKEIEPMTPESIFEKYNSSVVLIVNQYYYELKNDEMIYYYSPSSERKIFFDKEEVLKNLSSSTGTGFVISQNGEILTNRHVVNPKDDYYKVELEKLYDKFKLISSNDITVCNDSLMLIKNYYNENLNYLNDYEKNSLETKYEQLKNKKNFYIDMYDDFNNTDLRTFNMKLINYKLAIAFNDTHVTDLNDLQECVKIKESERDEVDLALIQTKTKQFLKAPKNIFNFIDNNPNLSENISEHKERNIKNPIKINDDVFMIGYNKGFSLANTHLGIKSQFTSGKISQENDGERILYTIPTLEGSSGSPIIDKWGNLVAVNFAKISNSQSFSFGIPVYQVKKFYEE